MIDPELKAFIEELLAPLGPVTIRRMFGGGGIFLDGLMFGLVSDDVIYLKVADASRPAFEAEGQEPFGYLRQGSRATLTSYWRIPDRLLDEPDEFVAWAQAAWAVARRAKKPARSGRVAAKGRGGKR